MDISDWIWTTFQILRFSLVPILPQPGLAQPLLVLGFVSVEERWLHQGWVLKLAAGLVVLPWEPFAFAGGDHGDLISSCAAVLALQLYALGSGFVVDAAPVVAAASAGPKLPATGPANPVLKHLSWEALACTHKLLDGVDAGAVAIRDVLCGPQLSAANLTSICG